jgi:hypothetical protein
VQREEYQYDLVIVIVVVAGCWSCGWFGVMAKRGDDVVKCRGIDVGRRTKDVAMRLETRSVQGRLGNLMVCTVH